MSDTAPTPKPTPPPEPDKVDDRPVYDKRGNVRPRGTEGARPMTFNERARIAARLNK